MEAQERHPLLLEHQSHGPVEVAVGQTIQMRGLVALAEAVTAGFPQTAPLAPQTQVAVVAALETILEQAQVVVLAL
jgi:hypothetical protein